MPAPSIVAALAPLALVAAAPPTAPDPLSDAAWLAGRWVGEGLGGRIEETWTPPADGQMVGHFRLVRDGKVAFYELLPIDRTAAGLRLRVKHFNPDFTGWEERAQSHEFAPETATPRDLRFAGLRYRLDGDTLVGSVAIRQRGAAKAGPVGFRLRRAPL